MKGRIRTIKPEIVLDEDLWNLCREMPDAPVFQVYTMLWCHADREERFEWRPQALKVLCCPYWDGDIDMVLRGLERHGKLLRYEVDGKQYGIVKNLKLHQAFNSREPVSRLPPPPGILRDAHACASADSCAHMHAREERKGTERNGNGNGTGTEREERLRAVEGPESTVVATVRRSEPTRPDNQIPDRPARAPGVAPEPRKDVFRTLAPHEWSPSDPGVAYARELGLSNRDIDETAIELRNWKGSRSFTVDWWDSKWNIFVENRSKPRKPVRSERAPKMGEPGWRRQPDAGAVNDADYEYDYSQDEVSNG